MSTAPDPTAFSSARCPSHQRAAVATCVRCGTFLCGECTELLGEAAYCASCVAFVRKHGAPSLLLKAALGLEVIALASIPLTMLLPFRALIHLGEVVYALAILHRVPVLNGLAAGLGFWSASRERRRLVRDGLAPSAHPWGRWVRALAWVNLGHLLLQLALLVRSFLHFYSGMQQP
ncbi:B-box zinc finger protein [Vitiosangium sp. GDMCC 1.1324]|uniref:B-box zinc finger protein n=1 Tax=Vitiosangium sp. (strain GDMCC 1.1324) TaxID=2138576 RepID=UPI000D38E536|nr:B-box zinc finger protein [Vitiosangium sp. GDMCC 1.1324]PTL84365.1 hypothetical protein DAT35_04515 [Vitiosangium sp. GDMCC 1.1324]